MGSFTDAITQFNPYVAQLPVDAMVKVGMQKQAQYEEGYKKIQGEIDRVAGLDIIRDVDKDYLQSKLDELGGNLKTYAAGDFSNFQLVNSVGGMARQVGKDEVVQNSVSSTAWYRKQQKAIEEAKKQGKSNVANEDLFSSQVNNWYKNPKAGASFSDEYVPYTDVFKKLQDIAKSVGEDSTIVQQLFQTDSNGNPILKNGQLQYNDVMAETLLKGKDKNKILDAFQNGLDANDYRQLKISGRYELKSKSRDDVSKMLNDGFEEYQKNSLLKKELIQDKIIELKTKGGSKEEIDLLQKAVTNIDLNISKRRQSVDDMLKSDDLDAIKGSIYTNNFLDSMSNVFSTKETYTKYSKNPAVEVMMDRERLKLDQNRFRLDQNRFRLDQDKFQYQQTHDREKMAQDRWAALFEKGLVDENGKPTGAGLYSGAARDLGIGDITDPLYFSNQFEQGLRDDMDTQFKLYEKVAIANWMANNSGIINPQTGKSYTKDEMKNQIAIYAKKLGKSYNDYVVYQGQKAADRYNETKGKSLGAEYADDFRAINELGNRIGINKKKMDNETATVAARAKEVGFTPFDFTKVNVQPIGDIEINVPTDYVRGKPTKSVFQKFNITKQDMYHLALLHEAGSLFGERELSTRSAVETENGKKAYSALLKKFGSDDNVNAVSRYVNRIPPGFSKESVNPFVNFVKSDNFKKTMQLREEYYKGISEVGVPKGITLYKDKAEQKEHLQSALTNVASDYIDIDNSYQDLIKAVNEDGSQFQINIDPAVSRYGKNSYNLQVTKKDGSVIVKPIMESHYKFITGKEAPSLFINEVLSAINASNYGSTNLSHMYTDDDAYSTAFVKDDQTRTKNYNVAMDFVPGSGNLLFPKLYVQRSDNDWKLVPYNAGLTPEEAKNFPSLVDDVFIKSLLQRK
jgi:hypothetical protein